MKSEVLFNDPEIVPSIERLNGGSKNLSMKIYNLLKSVDLKKLRKSSIEISTKKNRCIFFLNPVSDQEVDFQIDVYDNFYDLFVNNEEVFIQQENSNPDKSIRIIEEYLKSTIEVIIIQNKDDKILKKQFKFYFNGKHTNVISNISFFSFLYKDKRERIINYDAWIQLSD